MRRIFTRTHSRSGKGYNSIKNLYQIIVYSSLALAKKYFYYYIKGANKKGHGMHSPFVFDFILNVINNKNNYQPSPLIEKQRAKLLKDKRKIKIEDLGAGSRKNDTSEKAIMDIALAALKPKKYASILYRVVKHYQPRYIIELGTSLGITTAYLAAADENSNIFSLEGSRSIATVAKENLSDLNVNNVQIIEGNFDDTLNSVLDQLHSVDLAFIDGNHRYEPTVRYFYQLLQKIHNNSILVFDDIHWSPEMEKAWTEIKAHPTVKYTIDIFFLGFVFFRKEFNVKQDFTIRA